MTTISLKQYASSATSVPFGSGSPWVNQSNAFEESLLDDFSYSVGKATTWNTDAFFSKFDYAERTSFFADNPSFETINVTYYIIYRLSNTMSSVTSILSANLFSDKNTEGVFQDLGLSPIIENGTYTTDGVNPLAIATITFNNVVGVPSVYEMDTSDFALRLIFSISNDVLQDSIVEVYEIKEEITIGEITGPIIVINDSNGSSVSNNQIINYGSLVKNQNYNRVYRITNSGSVNMSLQGIVVGSNLSVPEIYRVPFTIDANSYADVNFTISVPDLLQHNEQISITNNSDNIPIFVFTFRYLGQESSLTSPIIDAYYGLSRIENNKTLSLSSVPLNISKIVTINIFNYGASSLNINSVYVSENATISSGNTLVSGSSISQNNSLALVLNLNVLSLGNKSVDISITSNDLQSNPFTFTLTYSVLAQFSVSISSGQTTIVDGSSFNVGSLDKSNTFTKSYILRNSGIYKTLIINSITANSDLSVVGTLGLPFTLNPNSSNSLVFTIDFNTDSVGLKGGNFVIDYSEGSVV